MVRQEMWSYSSLLGLVNAQSITHIMFQLYDVVRFDSTVVTYLTISYPKLNNQFFFNFEV